jgi:hypothetical protein
MHKNEMAVWEYEARPISFVVQVYSWEPTKFMLDNK